MTVVSIASFIQANAHPAHTDRRLTQSIFDGRGGVVPRTATFTDLKVSQRAAGANMSVDVAEGSCLVTGTESTYQGLYHCENQGVQNVGLTAANATNPRRDLIVARIYDQEYGVAVTNTFAIEAIAGTPAGSPADPTVPANCIVLARVAVAANATSITNANITDLRNGYAAVTGAAAIGNQVKAAALGGIVPCLSTFRPTVGLFEGQVIYETDTHLPLVYTGSAWTWLGTRGLLSYTVTTANQNGIQGTDVDVAQLVTPTLVIPTGRNIKLEASIKLFKDVADGDGYASVTLAKSDNTVYAVRDQWHPQASWSTNTAMVILPGTVSGSVVFKVRIKTTGTFENTLAGSNFAVYDMGPT